MSPGSWTEGRLRVAESRRRRGVGMFKVGTKILFQEPAVDRRLLRSATVAESRCEGREARESFVVRFDSEGISLREGDELIAYFHGRREFMQQVVRVVEVRNGGDSAPAVGLVLVGDEVSAESRALARTTTLSTDLFAALGEERRLSVEDVSSIGFAVVSSVEYAMGATLEVSLGFRGDFYSGAVLVQSVREQGPNATRYGLRALDEGDLQDGLDQISRALQGKC